MAILLLLAKPYSRCIYITWYKESIKLCNITVYYLGLSYTNMSDLHKWCIVSQLHIGQVITKVLPAYTDILLETNTDNCQNF